MTNKIDYRGNVTEEKKESGRAVLYINGKKIPTEKTNNIPEGFRSPYSYFPASSLMDLGKLVIDNQLSLTKPSLSGIKKEK